MTKSTQSPSPKGKQKRAGKAPKARAGCVRFSAFGSMHLSCMSSVVAHETDVVHHAAVIPLPAKQAKALVAFANLSEEEKVGAIIEALQIALFEKHNGADGRKNVALAVLQATGHIAAIAFRPEL